MNIPYNPFEVLENRLSNIENLLLDIKHAPKNVEQKTDDPQWLNIDEVCQYIPDKPSKATVYGWVHKNKIPVHKGGKRLRFLRSDIDMWLKQGRKKTLTEIASEADTYLRKR